MTSLKIVFAGTPEFGIPCLEALADSQHQLQAVYTQPDRPAGRGRSLQASAVKEWALKHQIPIYQPVNFKTPEAVAELAALKPDVLIVIAYGLILPKVVLEIPRFGCINVHASLLPRWRGASPIQHALLYGDKETGVTIMQMDVGLDTGAMYSKVICPISAVTTAASLHDQLAQISAAPLLATLDALAKGQAQPELQNEDLATYAAKINKEDARINWQQSAVDIDCRIRAFNPWPIAYTAVGEEFLRIYQAQPTEIACTEVPGTILSLDKKGLLVATGNKALLIDKIQFPGAKAIAVADWLNAPRSQLYVGYVFQ